MLWNQKPYFAIHRYCGGAISVPYSHDTASTIVVTSTVIVPLMVLERSSHNHEGTLLFTDSIVTTAAIDCSVTGTCICICIFAFAVAFTFVFAFAVAVAFPFPFPFPSPAWRSLVHGGTPMYPLKLARSCV